MSASAQENIPPAVEGSAASGGITLGRPSGPAGKAEKEEQAPKLTRMIGSFASFHKRSISPTTNCNLFFSSSSTFLPVGKTFLSSNPTRIGMIGSSRRFFGTGTKTKSVGRVT